MIKNVNLLVTNRCNSRCTMCNIWKINDYTDELTSEEYASIFLLDEFKDVEELAISGGEPFEREDLCEIVEGILKNCSSIKRLFITTNGTHVKKTYKFVERILKHIEEITLGVSIEGTEEFTNKIRGIKSYKKAVEILNFDKQELRGLKTDISMTITKENCNLESLEHVRDIALKTNSKYTFRLASVNDTYYKNINKKFDISDFQKKLIIDFINKNLSENKFMEYQSNYLETGKLPIMISDTNNILCSAGKTFVFIHPNGKIYPCLNSPVCIGDHKQGINRMSEFKIGEKEPCPCCTECTVWPMITYSNFAEV